MDDYTSGVGLGLIAINNDYKNDQLKNMCEVKYEIYYHYEYILLFQRYSNWLHVMYKSAF